MKPRTILLIEDDLAVRETSAEILALAGYDVLQAGDGRQGIDLARSARPDLVVCDIMMPEIDGYGVLHVVGRDPRTSDIPFIFLTAKTEPSDVRKGMDLGADDYITKPFDESVLLGAIESRLRRRDRFQRAFGEGTEGLDRLLNEARDLEPLKGLSRDRKVKKARRKEMLFHEGDDLLHVPQVISGVARTYKMNRDGKILVTGLCGPGDLIGYMGLLEGGRALESAEMVEDGEVSLIPREDLLDLLYKDRDVSLRFIRMLARNMAEKEAHMVHLAYASVRQRVANMLLRALEHQPNEGGTGIRISREEMASMAGIAHETVTRCLADLREEGAIQTIGREVIIKNRQALERLART